MIKKEQSEGQKQVDMTYATVTFPAFSFWEQKPQLWAASKCNNHDTKGQCQPLH